MIKKQSDNLVAYMATEKTVRVSALGVCLFMAAALLTMVGVITTMDGIDMLVSALVSSPQTGQLPIHHASAGPWSMDIGITVMAGLIFAVIGILTCKWVTGLILRANALRGDAEVATDATAALDIAE